MQAIVTAVTKEIPQGHGYSDVDKQAGKTFAGKNAGICYMANQYFDSNVTDPAKALKRFSDIAAIGHHSIADHIQVTVLFENVSKIMAMLLNSLGTYATSEKSARYTVMTTTGKTAELYDKWLKILKNRITETYPEMDEKLVTKLAQENARYFISVFNPSTTMSYTASIRQLNYIMDWCDAYVKNARESNQYETNLKSEIIKLRVLLHDCNLYVDELRDNKNRKFNFLANQVGYNILDCEDSYDYAYLIKYDCSFSALAQAQRHRTLDYFLCFNGVSEHFFIPPIIADTKLESEWIADMQSVADTTPQGTLVHVVESGLISNFILKCQERLCGRAQLEIMRNTINALKGFNCNCEIPVLMRDELRQHIKPNGKIKMKCSVCDCKEPCMWGPERAQTRLI